MCRNLRSDTVGHMFDLSSGSPRYPPRRRKETSRTSPMYTIRPSRLRRTRRSPTQRKMRLIHRAPNRDWAECPLHSAEPRRFERPSSQLQDSPVQHRTNLRNVGTHLCQSLLYTTASLCAGTPSPVLYGALLPWPDVLYLYRYNGESVFERLYRVLHSMTSCA